MKLTKRFKRSFVYQLARNLTSISNFLPRSGAVYIGAVVGLLGWNIIGKDRHQVNRHLKLAYGESMTFRERQLLGRNLYINLGKNLADVVRFRDHFKSELLGLITCEGAEHLKEAHQRGYGVFGVTGHIGNYELMAGYIASLGYQTALIGREVYDQRLDQLLVNIRKQLGLTVFRTTDSPRRMIKWLRLGHVCGVVIDTDSARVRSVGVPWFGRMSNSPVGQSLISLSTKAALVPMACVRKPNNGYHIIIRPAIKFDPTGDKKADSTELTSLCNKELEAIVRQYSDQWIWLHNRWRTKV